MALRLGSGLAAVLSFLLAATPAGEGAVRPRYGGSAVRGFLGEIRTLDPLAARTVAEREAARQVHAGLYRFDSEGEPVPDLVERAEVDREGTSVRLWLRRSWFHDGRLLVAEDARAAIERFAAAPGSGRLLRAGTASEGTPLVTVLGERELKLRVGGAPVLWPWLLADVRAAVQPAAGAGEAQGEAQGTVGAGPFAVSDLSRRGDRLVLAPHERHHRGRPLLDRLEYRAFADERALVLAHRHQGVDYIDAPGVEEPGGLTAVLGTVSEVVALRANAARAPLADDAVREAALNAIRIDALVDVVLAGKAERASGILNLRPKGGDGPADPARNSPQDTTGGKHSPLGPTGAQRRPPGSPSGIGGKRALLLVYPEGEGLRATAERIRVDLHAGGFAVELQGLGVPALATALAEGRYGLALVVLPGGEMPAVISLAEATSLLAADPPLSLLAAASSVQPRGEVGSDLFAAESAILAGGRLRPLFRRLRRGLCRDVLRDLRLGPDGYAVFEDAWRWVKP